MMALCHVASFCKAHCPFSGATRALVQWNEGRALLRLWSRLRHGSSEPNVVAGPALTSARYLGELSRWFLSSLDVTGDQ